MTGSLQIKNDVYYTVINYKDSEGKHKKQWRTTGLPIKGNKKRAEKILRERIKELESGTVPVEKIDFSNWLKQWLHEKEGQLAPTTFYGYKDMIEKHISPSFEKITLEKLTAGLLENYYAQKQQEGLSPNTIAKHHALIHTVLKKAVKMEYVSRNVAELAEPPKRVKKRIFEPYSIDELGVMLKAFKGDILYPVVYLAAVFGLRRSEILGLRWDSLNLEKGSMKICSTALRCKQNGRIVTVLADSTKTKDSFRCFPLNQEQISMFINLRNQQQQNRVIFGTDYSEKFAAYVFVNEQGNLLQPDYITHRFRKILKSNNLRHIRFHDLRHSCATALLYFGHNLKDIQNWLGHSNYNFTADTYIHADETNKVNMLRDVESISSF